MEPPLNGTKAIEVPEFLQEIASAFGFIPGVEAVAWCGSAAMGMADAHSDFDFYVYTNAPVSGSVSSPVIDQVSGMLSRLDRWLGKNGV